MSVPTVDEIKQRYTERSASEMFGFESDEYIPYTDAPFIRSIVKPETTDDEIAEMLSKEPLTREHILRVMEDYMEFAWGKENDCRSISANRSVMHYIAWIWLAGDRELAAEIDWEYNAHYGYYGKSILERICKHYGWDYSRWDDGRRVNRSDE